MLDDDLKPQLAAYLERLVRPIVLVASVDDGDKSRELLALLEDIRALSDKVSVEVHRDDGQRKPSFAVTSPGHDIDLRFAGLPMGHEFRSEQHTSELQSLMRISYAVFCLKKQTNNHTHN